MGKKRMTKILSLLLVMFTTMSITAFAGSNKTYYAKATATAVGNGKVYVGTTNTAPTEEKYQESSEIGNSKSATGNSANVGFYLFAQPGASNFKLEGWYDNAECTGNALSTANPYSVQVSSNVTTEADAVIKTYYAKFVEASVFYSSTLTATVVGEGGLISVSKDAETNNYDAEKSSASNLNDVEEKCNYYLKAQVEDPETYRFVGWYSDAACENQISKNATYTYAVTAESTDESNPTAVEVYAKFEAIPYYYSSVNATAVGDGKVYVNTKNATTEDEWATESDNNQKVADKAVHTYYLYAQVDNEDVEFDGWFADEECTEFLSAASPYFSYKVTSESQDSEEVSSFNVYAKFSARNYYQVRNGGFEKWAKENEPGFGWNSFPSATGSMAATGKGMSPNPEKVEGRNGGSAVRIFSKYAGMLGIGANANGNLTTGVVNMGSMTPTDASNHNYSDVADPVHSLFIAGQPDGVEFYTKYKKGEEGEYLGHANFIIHDEYNYRDPEVEAELEHKIGECGAFIEESEEWVRNYAEFSYEWDKDAAEATDKYLLINFTTNMTPGGSVKDTLIIDDVRLIYNSELATATYDEKVVNFTDGAASIDAIYDAKKLALTSNGRAATIETDYDAKTAVLTITVKGQDYEADETNAHVYTIHYLASAEMKITEAKWATFCAPFAVEIPEGVTVYTIEGNNDNVLTLNNLADVIPANTAVVLNSEAVKTETFTGVAEDGDPEGTWLTGVYEETDIEDGYVLENHNGKVGFYKVNSTITVPANRAYLTVPTSEANERAFFFDVETAIATIEALTSGKAEIYNMNGMKINALQKGINIVNGKKVLVK